MAGARRFGGVDSAGAEDCWCCCSNNLRAGLVWLGDPSPSNTATWECTLKTPLRAPGATKRETGPAFKRGFGFCCFSGVDVRRAAEAACASIGAGTGGFCQPRGTSSFTGKRATSVASVPAALNDSMGGSRCLYSPATGARSGVGGKGKLVSIGGGGCRGTEICPGEWPPACIRRPGVGEEPDSLRWVCRDAGLGETSRFNDPLDPGVCCR